MNQTSKIKNVPEETPEAPPVKFRVVVIVPVLEPLAFEYGMFKHFNPSPVSTVNELTKFSAKDLCLTEYRAENLRVVVRKTRTNKKQKKKAKGGLRIPVHNFTEIEWSVNLTITDFRVEVTGGEPIPLVERISIWKQIACQDFASRVISILIASHIAQPGILRTREIEIRMGKKFLKTTEGISGHFGEVVEFAGEKAWPAIEALSVKQVWDWMCLFKPLSDNLGRSPIELALNALSYLLSEKPIDGRTLVDLMWAMIGLEALYGRGTSDLTYQLVEKAGVLLGQSAGFEKSVRACLKTHKRLTLSLLYFCEPFRTNCGCDTHPT